MIGKKLKGFNFANINTSITIHFFQSTTKRTMANMDMETMIAEINRLKAENEALKAKPIAVKPLTFKVSEKGAVSVYNLNARFPVTLYKGQWARLLDRAEDIKKFIEENNDKLSEKAPAAEKKTKKSVDVE